MQKSLDRLDPTYRLDRLPKLDCNSFSWGGKVGYTGSIVRRPLKKGGPFNHYGVVYGFDDANTLWMIENNDYGVECVTWRDFLSQSFEVEFVHFELEPSRHSEILLRAFERSELLYEAGHNNCEHFANYCVHGKLESFQADGVKKMADALFSLVEMRILMSPNSRDHQLILEWNKLRETLKLERNAEMQNLINNQLKR